MSVYEEKEWKITILSRRKVQISNQLEGATFAMRYYLFDIIPIWTVYE